MAFIVYYLFILLPLFFFLYFLLTLHISRNENHVIPRRWPLLGMLPKSLVHSHRVHDYISDILACTNGTFLFNGSSILRGDRLFTANPLDVHHILSKNFNNYPRGDAFRKIFDVLGDGFSNTDGEIWDFHHKTILSLLKSPCFQNLLEETIWNKVEIGLLPVLEYASNQEVEMDLQDIFQRFSFDTICKLIFNIDPKSMSLDFPHIPCDKALSEMEEAIMLRYIVPPKFSRIQELLQIGNEKKMSNAWKTVDEFIYKCLAQNQSEEVNYELQEDKFKLSTSLLREYKDQGGSSGDRNKFFRDTLLNLMVAGRDTTSSALTWLFYLLSKNPRVEDLIRKELQTQLEKTEKDVNLKDFQALKLNKLVYLHGALSEALRLFPPVPFQAKSPSQPDILPSGHQVDKDTTIILSFYSMGRMKSIWGEDCMDFKPERWINSVSGEIIHQPSYKFPTFNAGPRTCLGKNMSFTQMKIVAATIIYHYHVDAVKGQGVFPSASILLKMKDGLKVKFTKRSEVKD
uniref:alkane hydroxylase MAH1-like n=1 Tax=Erigeron canadensis TaxID=72917 RepID=UPI001CB96B4D|nr:alkane hydroxylase MAH1-like [Erigeron canadensis]